VAALGGSSGTALAAAAIAACLGPSIAHALDGGVKELWTESGRVRFMLDTCATDVDFELAATDADASMAYDILLSTLLARGRVRIYDRQGGPIASCPQRDTQIGSVRALP
jgi:hypothetical protein